MLPADDELGTNRKGSSTPGRIKIVCKNFIGLYGIIFDNNKTRYMSIYRLRTARVCEAKRLTVVVGLHRWIESINFSG
jgi:hypothetical protein